MEFESGVKSARERMDFAGVHAGASMWFQTKGQALTMQDAFRAWNKTRRLPLETSVEKTFYDDPVGKGYRLYWLTVEVEQDENDAMFEAWLEERAIVTTSRPIEGWHLTSLLHADYKEWMARQGTPGAGDMLSIPKFSQKVAAIPGVKRDRVARGSIAIGLALKAAKLR